MKLKWPEVRYLLVQKLWELMENVFLHNDVGSAWSIFRFTIHIVRIVHDVLNIV